MYTAGFVKHTLEITMVIAFDRNAKYPTNYATYGVYN